jgi:hypothetical protein
MNAWWVPEEMAMGMKDAQPKVIFCDRERLERLFERPRRYRRLQGRFCRPRARSRASRPGAR